MSTTSYAVSAKARSKYGRFLTDRDYASILACQSVPEVMVYLKSHTHYASVLSEVNERDVHRGRLEMLLRQYLFNEFVEWQLLQAHYRIAEFCRQQICNLSICHLIALFSFTIVDYNVVEL